MISIIIPVYNSDKYIDRCLSSVMSQNFDDFECICVDDGSTDKSAVLVRNATLKDGRFKYIYQENSGPSAARNTGIDNAMGEYIVFIDSDDTIEVDYLERLYNGISNVNADICCCGYKYISNQSYIHNDFHPTAEWNQESFIRHILSGTGGCVWGAVYKTNIIRKYNIRFNSNFRMCEDQLFKLEYTLKAASFTSIDYNGYNYIETAGGLTKQLDYDKWYQQFDLVDIMKMTLSEAGYINSIIAKMLLPKERNIVMALAWACHGHNYSRFFKDKRIKKVIGRMSIRNLSDIKWIIPLKLRLEFLLRLIY